MLVQDEKFTKMMSKIKKIKFLQTTIVLLHLNEGLSKRLISGF